MTRSSMPRLILAVALLCSLPADGCSQKTEQGLSPADRKRFGYVGMPMPPEAKRQIEAQKTPGGPPKPATR